MQKEIAKRTKLYGVAAVIIALVLGTLCYNLGIYPQIALPTALSTAKSLKTFSSYEDLRSFLLANSKTQQVYQLYGPWDTQMLQEGLSIYGQAMGTPKSSSLGRSATDTNTYSTTNIQVAGVDEADKVKNDGQYIYVVSSGNVSILMAYPTEKAKVLSTIRFDDMYPAGIFVSGDRLAVLGSKYIYPPIMPFGLGYRYPAIVDTRTFINVYDVSDRANPVLLTHFTVTGSYFNSRMIGDYIYFVASQAAIVIDDKVFLPMIESNDGQKEISPPEIHYNNVSDDYFQFTTFVAVNMQDTTQTPTYTTIMLGGTSDMYVSPNNIYVTYSDWQGNTSIYRMHIANDDITWEANGTVPGHELNQFSMDEYNNDFRIATATWVNGTARSNLYVLDMNLSIIGRLEDIEPGETLDSTRFIGNRCYLSTSVVRRDPFFVIDVGNPNDLKILGGLKIPGFTRYLHPYDEEHVIGVGKDGNKVKISLFDVTNVSAPIEIGNYTVSDDWSDTVVLSDHKAFLFDGSKDLLVLPVSTSAWGPNYSSWQGALVFNITLSNGIVLRGNVTHQETNANYWDSGYWIDRSLYIENVLYTVSDKKIKMNSMVDLAPLNVVELP
jgi:inhibitor of cysteine peptidase